MDGLGPPRPPLTTRAGGSHYTGLSARPAGTPDEPDRRAIDGFPTPRDARTQLPAVAPRLSGSAILRGRCAQRLTRLAGDLASLVHRRAIDSHLARPIELPREATVVALRR